jgi:hypothetical protein
MYFEKMPCLMALRATRLFPAGVFGPVDFAALRRLASTFLVEVKMVARAATYVPS